MLNRKLSDYIFIGIMLGILLFVLGIRTVALGAINNNILELEGSNITLSKRITKLETKVELYKDVQSDRLFNLYHNVPSYYSYNELYFNVLTQMYLVGINDTPEFNSKVTIEEEVGDVRIPGYDTINSGFKVVEVQLSFNVLSVSTVEDLLDNLYNSEQVFIVNAITFNIPDEILEDYVTVQLSFYTFYDIENGN